MKKLTAITLGNLTNIKFGEHAKETISTINTLAAITDPVLLIYFNDLQAQSNNYQLAMVYHAKSDDTIKIEAADVARDLALSAFFRQLSVYEISDSQSEIDSYNSLKNIVNNYGNIQRADYAQETGLIDNLIVDLNTAKYASHISALNMNPLQDRINNRNNDFKALFLGRTQESIGKIHYDVKDLRNKMKTSYQLFANYIVTMANALNNQPFNDMLDAVNAVRKYFSDEMAKMKGTGNNTNPTPIA